MSFNIFTLLSKGIDKVTGTIRSYGIFKSLIVGFLFFALVNGEYVKAQFIVAPCVALCWRMLRTGYTCVNTELLCAVMGCGNRMWFLSVTLGCMQY